MIMIMLRELRKARKKRKKEKGGEKKGNGEKTDRQRQWEMDPTLFRGKRWLFVHRPEKAFYIVIYLYKRETAVKAPLYNVGKERLVCFCVYGWKAREIERHTFCDGVYTRRWEKKEKDGI